MEIFAGLSVGLLILSSLVVATRTLALWRRSRQLPELLLGMMLLSATVVGYPAAIACTRISASQVWEIHVLYPVAINLGFACLLLFTMRVFRPNARWAACLVGGTLLVLVGSAATYIVQALGENPRPPVELVGLSLVNSAGIAVAYCWTTIESLHYYRRLRLQVRLGLAEVLVANRMLLWSLMCLAAGVAVFVNGAGMLAGTFMSPGMVSVSSVLGLAHASCLFLAFHPPAWYRGWVERRAVPAAG